MLGSRARSHANLKSLAVIASPLDHFIPSLKWNVYVSPSSEISYFSASPGTGCLVLVSIFVKPSLKKSM